MNGVSHEKKRLDALIDALTDEVLTASDEDVLAEADRIYGDPDSMAAIMQAQLMRKLEENQDLAATKRSWDADEQSSRMISSSKRSS